jgi:hypothetical protein
LRLEAFATSVRLTSLETLCFELLLTSLFCALAAWSWGIIRKSFGAGPAIFWLIFCGIALLCAAAIGILEIARR